MSLQQDIYSRCSCGEIYAEKLNGAVIFNLSGCNPYVERGASVPEDMVNFSNGQSVSACRKKLNAVSKI